jgi:hypothetical protein
MREVFAMVWYFITFRSVTYAQRGERALRRAGISCKIQRTPRWMEERGCGYSLGLKEIGEAAMVLQKNQIPFRKIYRRNGDGSMEEVEP